jgi:LPS sulfotransferase NodH
MTRYTELQISSELLDQPEFLGSPKKVVICSTPRSGSYLLCRHMINAGLGIPHEYFNPIVIRQIAPRLGFAAEIAEMKWHSRGRRDSLLLRKSERVAERAFLTRYVSALMAMRTQGGVFASKIHYRDFVRVLDNSVGHRLFDDAVFVYLYREDLLRQAVSERFAQLTGRWGIDDTVTTPPAANPDFFDVAGIDWALVDLANQERGWRVFMARNGVSPLSISYERLCEDPFAFVVAIARRLGVDPATLRQGYSEVALTEKADPGLPSKSEVASRYVASARACDRSVEDGQRLDIRGLVGGSRAVRPLNAGR